MPATIGNNLPATEFTIGADTALNNIVDAVDKIKYTASAAHRVYIIEVMGRRCGYLALTAGIATGAEMELLPEDGISLQDLMRDTEMLRRGFQSGKKLGIVIIAEETSPYYDTDFVRRVIDAESGGAFDVRECILGHLQRGGAPTAFDRIQGARLGARAAQQIMEDITAGRDHVTVIGLAAARDPPHTLRRGHGADGHGQRPADATVVPALARPGGSSWRNRGRIR